MHMRARVHGLAYMPLYPVACACSGGFSMLGLGDIVMPGLLLSFAVRFDYDTHLTAKKGYGPAAHGASGACAAPRHEHVEA